MQTLEIDVVDEIAPLLERMTAHNRGFLKSAAKSLGYFMQKEIKQEAKPVVILLHNGMFGMKK